MSLSTRRFTLKALSAAAALGAFALALPAHAQSTSKVGRLARTSAGGQTVTRA